MCGTTVSARRGRRRSGKGAAFRLFLRRIGRHGARGLAGPRAPDGGAAGGAGSLAIDYGGVSAERVLRAGVSATKFRAHADEASTGAHARAHGHDRHQDDEGAPQAHHAHHTLKEIAGFIRRSALSPQARDRAIHLFERLAEAEAAIHDMPIDAVHLHEVGALDSIIDIVGAVYGLEWLGAAVITSSPLNVGSGTVECAHGTFPVPAPATARLLQGVPIYSGPVAKELVTPTGALIVTSYASAYGPLPPMRVDRVGYGAGSRDFKRNPNVVAAARRGDRERGGGRTRRDDRVRDRRHEPATLRAADGSAGAGWRARRVLRRGADEEGAARGRWSR